MESEPGPSAELLEEAAIAWHEQGHADEAQYDRAKENSRDEWEFEWALNSQRKLKSPCRVKEQAKEGA